MSKRLENLAWWLGVPLIVAALTWVPYAALNMINSVAWPFWRVPFVPIAIFDSSAYYQWIGASLSGLSYGSHIRSFDLIIRTLGHIVPDSWSVAEVWLLTLWASVTVGVWLMAKCISVWSGCSPAYSRWFSVIALSTFALPFMPRPGVFTWYIAFYAFGLIGIWRVQRLLDRRSYPQAVAWTIASLAATWVYPYFLIHAFLWLAVTWFIHVHHRFLGTVRMIYAAGIIAVVPIIGLMMPWIMRPEFRLIYELQERVGLALTRLPVISNSLLLVFFWMAFLALFAFIFIDRSEAHERLYGLMIGWITLLAGWLSNVFTGVYIHNDHFRASVLILSWISLAFIFKTVQEAPALSEDLLSMAQRGKKRAYSFLAFAFFIASSAMFCIYIFKKAYVFHADLLNVIHASHWLAFAVASFVLWNRFRSVQIKAAYLVPVISLLAIALGVLGRGYVYAREAEYFSSYVPYVDTISWIRTNVPPDDGVCTDPEHAEVFGSFSGRMTYPTFATLVLPKSDEDILNDIRVELASYDAISANQEDAFIEGFNSTRVTTCSQFNYLRAMLSRFGVNEAQFKSIASCPEGEIQEGKKQIQDFLVSQEPQDEAFRSLCPAVVIASDQAGFWSLPDDYTETKIDETFSVWRKFER